MRAGFSEFSFAYTLTKELIEYKWRANQVVPPPFFPTMREEGHLGYDVRLGPPGDFIFLQFKLCDGMVRQTAKELAVEQLGFQLPFLRMKLMPRAISPQHERLVRLAETGERVFYAAPGFYEYEDFADHFQTGRILENSVFIDPSDIGLLPGSEQHFVSFDIGATYGWVLSDPFKLERILGRSELVENIETSEINERPSDERTRLALSRMLAALSQTGIKDEDMATITAEAPFEQCAILACKYFDAFLFPIYSKYTQLRT